ncbi:MAG TPA: hypothetical protein VKM94_17465 [Blastocatellia bacterium]|nr:hypothetical protein [Blastocatellia bacterium]
METKPIIGAIVDDMFFAAKIRAAAEQAGKAMETIKSIEQLDSFLAANSTASLVVDLNSTRVDPLLAIQHVRSRADWNAVVLVSFVSHVQTDLIRQAQRAGSNYVLPRSAFTRFLPAIAAGEFEQLDASSSGMLQ